MFNFTGMQEQGCSASKIIFAFLHSILLVDRNVRRYCKVGHFCLARWMYQSTAVRTEMSALTVMTDISVRQ